MVYKPILWGQRKKCWPKQDFQLASQYRFIMFTCYPEDDSNGLLIACYTKSGYSSV